MAAQGVARPSIKSSRYSLISLIPRVPLGRTSLRGGGRLSRAGGEGYVPNVVYTCGAMRHRDQIVRPYAVSDTYCNFATIRIEALLQALSPVTADETHDRRQGARPEKEHEHDPR